MNRKKFFLIAILLMALSGPTLAAESPAQFMIALPYATDIGGSMTSYCFRLGNSTANGVAASLKPCAYNNTTFQPSSLQSFTLWRTGIGSDGDLFELRVKHSNKCLVVANNSTAYGAAIVQQTCALGNHWYINWHGDTVSIRSPHSNKCITGTADAALVQGSCAGNAAWIIRPVGSNVRIYSYHTWKCLDVDNSGGTPNGARVQQWDCLSGQTNQLWNIELGTHSNGSEDPSLIRLRPMHSGKCIGPGTTNFINGTPVKQYSCNSNASTEWLRLGLRGTSAGGLRFNMSPSSNPYACIDLDMGGGMLNGTKVQMWDCLGSNQNNQLWVFKQIVP